MTGQLQMRTILAREDERHYLLKLIIFSTNFVQRSDYITYPTIIDNVLSGIKLFFFILVYSYIELRIHLT